MMAALIVEAALRSCVLSGAIWLLLKLVRLRDLRAEKWIWTGVAAISLAMPALLRTFTIPLPQHAFPAQAAGRIEVLAVAQAHTVGLGSLLWYGYCLISAGLLWRFARGLWIAARIRREAVPVAVAAPLQIRASGQVRAPSSIGATILLPLEWACWDARKLRAVLAHEGAHIREHDHYRLWLAAVYCAVFWFNPAAHWVRRRLTMLAELLSDEAAIAATGDRIAYAQILVNFAAGPQPSAVGIAMAAPSTLTSRLDRLLENDMSSRNLGRTWKLTLMTSLAAVAATTTFGAPQPMTLTQAQDSLVYWVSGDALTGFYPKDAQAAHLEGTVTCRLTIDATGGVTDVVAVTVSPENSGFGLAAVEAAKSFHFVNTLSRPVVKVMAVSFRLN
jgi:TonB family protein